MRCKDCRYYTEMSESVGSCSVLGVVRLQSGVAALDFEGAGGVPVMSDFTAVFVWAEFGCNRGATAVRCPQCDDDRTGKGSLINSDGVFCDERCLEAYREAGHE